MPSSADKCKHTVSFGFFLNLKFAVVIAESYSQHTLQSAAHCTIVLPKIAPVPAEVTVVRLLAKYFMKLWTVYFRHVPTAIKH